MSRSTNQAAADVPRLFDVTIKLQNTTGDPVRVVRLPDMSLYDLHVVIQYSFDWCEGHLWTFETPQRNYFGPVDGDENGGDFGDDWDDADAVTVAGFFDRGIKKMTYLYDFGDSWDHRVSIREVGQSKAKSEDLSQLPRCVRGSGAAPPEDCGGPWGYGELVEAALAPAGEDEEADGRLDYYGITRPFDPEKCDIDEVNRGLNGLFSKSIQEDELGDAEDVRDTNEVHNPEQPGDVDDREISVQLETFIVNAGGVGYIVTAAAIPEELASENRSEADANAVTSEQREIVARFCRVTDDCFERLEDDVYDAEFFGNCRAALTNAIEMGVDVFSGKPEGWAAAAINVVAGVNMMQAPYKNGNDFFLSNDDIARTCGVSVATMTNRAKQLRTELEVMAPGDFRFLVESRLATNFELQYSAARSVGKTLQLSQDSAIDVVCNLDKLREILNGRELVGIVEMPIEQARETMDKLERGEDVELTKINAQLSKHGLKSIR